MIRFEILLPLFYNDGRPIEQEKFLQTDDERVQRCSRLFEIIRIRRATAE